MQWTEEVLAQITTNWNESFNRDPTWKVEAKKFLGDELYSAVEKGDVGVLSKLDDWSSQRLLMTIVPKMIIEIGFLAGYKVNFVRGIAYGRTEERHSPMVTFACDFELVGNPEFLSDAIREEALATVFACAGRLSIREGGEAELF